MYSFYGWRTRPRGNAMPSDLGPVTTPLHVAPPARAIPRGVEKEPTTAITTLETHQVRTREQRRC